MLLTKEVDIILHGKNILYFESLGYPIPRIKNKLNKLTLPKGIKIKVKVEDLMTKSTALVDVQCDNCGIILKNIAWNNYKKYSKNGNYYCISCARKIHNSSKNANKTKLKKSKSFKHWCLENLDEKLYNELLFRWDTIKNKCNIDEVSYSSDGFEKKGYWFKCIDNPNHESELKNINSFTHGHLGSIKCNQCNSFEQWCIENERQDILDRWDYDLNDCKPSEITYGIHEKYYFKCSKGIHKSELKYIKSFTSGLSNIECISCNSIAQYFIDTFDENKLQLYLSKKNKNIDIWKLNKFSNKPIYWKCCDKKHKDYPRDCYSAIRYNFRCPECTRERTESFLQEKVRLYLKSLNYTILHERKCTIIPQNPKIKNKKGQLPFDNEIKELKLITEVHGEQHYNLHSYSSIWKSKGLTPKQQLHKRKLYDRYKRIYAKTKGYEYLEIPYWTDDKNETWKILINNKINEILHKHEERNKQIHNII